MELEKQVENAQSLTDSAVLILSHLDKLPSIEPIKDILSLIDYSPISNYRNIFEDVRDFHNQNGRFPEPNYLDSKYAPKYYSVPSEYSYDVLLDFTNQLKKHKKLQDITKAISNCDLEKIADIVSKDVIKSSDNPTSIDDVESLYEELERQPSGMLLGIPELDHYVKGLDYGTMNVISAPVGTFKSTLAISTAYHACFNEGKKVVYFTLEITPVKVFYDLIARHSYELGTPLDAGDIKKGRLNPQQKEIFKNVVANWKENCKGKLYVIGTKDIAEYSQTYLEAFIRKLSENMGGLDMLYIDYLNLLKNKIPASLKLDQYQALNYYTQFFTDLAVRMNFILMMLCQVSRTGTEKLDSQASKEGGKKLASTTFFAEANEVERSASVAFILHATKAMKNRNNVDIFVVKNRDGACPEEPITTVVVPQYFLVGTKEFTNLTSTDNLINNCMTNPTFASDTDVDEMDLSNFLDQELGEE